MQDIIDTVKELVVKNKLETIWKSLEIGKPTKMNETFLLMYLLRNSDKKLKN